MLVEDTLSGTPTWRAGSIVVAFISACLQCLLFFIGTIWLQYSLLFNLSQKYLMSIENNCNKQMALDVIFHYLRSQMWHRQYCVCSR